MRATLVATGLCMCAGIVIMVGVHAAPQAYAAAALYGIGTGGLVTALPIAWADYFGRRSYGAIRGAALSIQVTAQAIGPVLSGGLRDWRSEEQTSELQSLMRISYAV